MRLRDALMSALWFGLAAGLTEVLVLAFRKLAFGQTLGTSRDFVWMVPVANLIVALPLALAAVAAVAILARLGRRVAAFPVVTFCLAGAAFMDVLLLVPRFHPLAALLLALGLAAQTTRVLWRRPAAFGRLVRRTVPWMIVAVLAMTAGVHGGEALAERRAVAALPAAPKGAPNVLLIVIDTARAANFSLYGYSRKTTPHIDQLGEKSAVFDRVMSTAPWTLPSHAGMFTGRWAHELSANWQQPLDDTYPTLAERLSARGYLTAGFVANVAYCSRDMGLARGFIHYEDYPLSLGQLARSSALLRRIGTTLRIGRRCTLHPGLCPQATPLRRDEKVNRVHAGEINRRFERWLDTRDSARPFFVFLNYYDVHGPYMPFPPFDKFGPPRTKEPIRRKFFDPSAPLPSRRDIAAEMGAYDGTLAWVDDRVGALIDDLGRRGLLSNTVVIVTSDHGEEFGEHGVFGHGNSLYLASVHVPLVMFYPPRVPAVRVAETVSLRDLPSTVMDLVGASGASSFPGHSLTRFWDGSGPSAGARDPIVSSVRPPDRVPPSFPVAKGEMTALAGQSDRYIHNGDGSEELYDFGRDYWEQHNLAGQEAGQKDVARFRATLKRVLPTRTVQAGNAKP